MFQVLMDNRRKVKLDPRYDWIGRANANSRIRPIILRRVENETKTERSYREAREELNRWNSDFWADHNQYFEKCKTDFVDGRKKKHGALAQVSPEEMSAFYRNFLAERKQTLAQYNTEWYKRNAQLIWPAMKVAMIRLRRFFIRG